MRRVLFFVVVASVLNFGSGMSIPPTRGSPEITYGNSIDPFANWFLSKFGYGFNIQSANILLLATNYSPQQRYEMQTSIRTGQLVYMIQTISIQRDSRCSFINLHFEMNSQNGLFERFPIRDFAIQSDLSKLIITLFSL